MTFTDLNSANFRFGDFTVDRAKFRVFKGQEIKTLPPKAFDLLIYLIDHRDRVIEKQELFENVWHESFVTDNALTRAIKEIRRELEDDAGSPRYIATIHKRGYRFIGEVVDGAQQPLDSSLATEVTPGNRGRPAIDKADRAPDRSQLIKAVSVFAVAALLVIAGSVFYFGGSPGQIRSLAVLPLENSTGNPDAEYMSDGLTESLINSLSRLPQIRVIPRTTAFRYKHKDYSPQQLGRELGVDAVMTGRVTRQGDDLVVQTELISTVDGSQFWGERFSRKLSDAFLLQEEIAKVISQKLRLKLSGEDERRLTRRYTDNALAYEHYLKGRYYLSRLTPPDVQRSVSFF